MKTIDIQQLAQYCLSAEEEKQEIVRITEEYPNLTVEDAYLIQEELVNIKLAQGKKILGPKMGLTSRPKMVQMGVEEPIYGFIFDYMNVPNQEVVSMSDLIHPKVEAEIAFILGKDIEGPGITGAQVLAATEFVVPALEIIDSRYQNFKFTLPDVIADNASSSRVVFGKRIPYSNDLDLELVGVTITINGKLRDFGTGAAVLGNPAQSVAMLANMLSRKGKKLKKGEVILTGGITEALLLETGDAVTAKLDGLGEVSFSIK
ncbi:2-keto-4-pentenoate hydratase [uncultured Brevibacillus sp.]|uniref:2-keto-4-pentenoate hydratase n=1 Tax=uncultured Brevibacillus sp. TaxID=169970 RepID=UPI002591E40A|nr:fumarylacetoacetate hydrolase family protein [uncultured Brevibacillus sp.]